MTICFATNNANKLREAKKLLQGHFEVVGLKDIGCTEDIPETSDTIEGNSLLKANYVFEKYNIPCFADDTGLEVDSLNGEPGVYSARYAGGHHNNEANMSKLLRNLAPFDDRSAQFKTVITYKSGSVTSQFEGIVKGKIEESASGTQGFGYDPIFTPSGYERTFAEMTSEEKNAISHRGIALNKLISYLKSLNN
ncbi:MAG: non-canonical purine NTP diphosphatase [bacterium]|nr:non-canonical purine NTP diphosphatase [bacterium]